MSAAPPTSSMQAHGSDGGFVAMPPHHAKLPPSLRAVKEAHAALAASFPLEPLQALASGGGSTDAAGEASAPGGSAGVGTPAGDAAAEEVETAVVMLRAWVALDSCNLLTGLTSIIRAVKEACDVVSASNSVNWMTTLRTAEVVLYVKAGLVLLGIITQAILDHSVDLLREEGYWQAQAMSPMSFWFQSLPVRIFGGVAARLRGEAGDEAAGAAGAGAGGAESGGNVGGEGRHGRRGRREGVVAWLGRAVPLRIRSPIGFLQRWRAGEVAFSTEVSVRDTLSGIARLQDTLLPHLGRCVMLVSSISRVCAAAPTAAVLNDLTRFTLVTVLDMAAGVRSAALEAPPAVRYACDAEFLDDLTALVAVAESEQLKRASSSSDDRLVAPGAAASAERVRMYLPLLGAIAEASHCGLVLDELHEPLRIPSHWFRRWPHYLVGAVGAFVLYRQVFQRRASIAASMVDMWETSVVFVQRRVVEPLRDIYATIRYDASKVGLMSAQSLMADTESLKRMVADFVVEHRNDADVDAVLAAAEAGDITVVMREYETGIRKPIAGLLFGSMLRTILIQVQKQKVDVDRAMAALDQIMRSNELNFQLIAAIPALVVFGWLFRATSGLVFSSAQSASTRSLHRELRLAVRRVEIMLNDNMAETESLSLLEHGALVILVHKLWVLARRLPASVRSRFEDDIRMLLLTSHPIPRKLATLHRMYRQYDFMHTSRWRA
ncbi:uncharacterized protein AMSG_01290 [Thecamonas trahens ATCC 50062]|uniref:Nuclear control of ATPase protein 2 n=1 Tax=Thecamonas trahens ATCC 50062 TaxID=461836 RepID=A0A0L0DMV2_THETB|nr:hypothetical protein AMSG_01290 [Thecamonas trahens ATCC 50062]KNC53580.1 hypothetical protein AMSG_01290 [Thecamonas trahens ATCC 50062]|eukprot:XP_013761897.1 hypothetical protein AMSG_01290 [Thecamonas trahens ATCC 50062]